MSAARRCRGQGAKIPDQASERVVSRAITALRALARLRQRAASEGKFPPKSLVSFPASPYILECLVHPGRLRGYVVSDNGLQKLAFFLLLALILYVSITGGA